jgi:hypothetical protein
MSLTSLLTELLHWFQRKYTFTFNYKDAAAANRPTFIRKYIFPMLHFASAVTAAAFILFSFRHAIFSLNGPPYRWIFISVFTGYVVTFIISYGLRCVKAFLSGEQIPMMFSESGNLERIQKNDLTFSPSDVVTNKIKAITEERLSRGWSSATKRIPMMMPPPFIWVYVHGATPNPWRYDIDEVQDSENKERLEELIVMLEMCEYHRVSLDHFGVADVDPNCMSFMAPTYRKEFVEILLNEFFVDLSSCFPSVLMNADTGKYYRFHDFTDGYLLLEEAVPGLDSGTRHPPRPSLMCYLFRFYFKSNSFSFCTLSDRRSVTDSYRGQKTTPPQRNDICCCTKKVNYHEQISQESCEESLGRLQYIQAPVGNPEYPDDCDSISDTDSQGSIFECWTPEKVCSNEFIRNTDTDTERIQQRMKMVSEQLF